MNPSGRSNNNDDGFGSRRSKSSKSRRNKRKANNRSLGGNGTDDVAPESTKNENNNVTARRRRQRELENFDGDDSNNLDCSESSSDEESQYPGAIRVGGRSGVESLADDTLYVGSGHNPLTSSLQNRSAADDTPSTTVVAHLAPNLEEEVERRIEELNRSKPSGASTAVIAEVMDNPQPRERAESSSSSNNGNDLFCGFTYKSLFLCAMLVLVSVVVTLVVTLTLSPGGNVKNFEEPASAEIINNNIFAPSPAPSSQPTTNPPTIDNQQSPVPVQQPTTATIGDSTAHVPSSQPTTNPTTIDNQQSPVPVQQPTTATIGASTSTPSRPFEQVEFSTRFEILYNMISSDVVGGEAQPEEVLRDIGRPQYMALQWLADVDGAYSNFDVVPKQVLIERYVIVLLYFITGGIDDDNEPMDIQSAWERNPNFLTSSSICDWNYLHQFGCLDIGVECIESQFVTSFSLARNGLEGYLPTEIGLLSSLTGFDVTGNSLSGTIPTEIGLLTDTVALYLGSNEFTGTIPTEFGNLSLIRELYLDSNMITGIVPTEFDRLTDLNILCLHGNDLWYTHYGNIPCT